MKIKNKVYGAYGSNMNTQQMMHRCPAATRLYCGTLADYALTFRGQRRGVANIERRSGGRVPFVVWQITDACEEALDRYEGYPALYGKVNLPVACDDGVTRAAMVYVMTPYYESLPALPDESYLNVILGVPRQRA